MWPFKGMVKTRGEILGANQEFSFNYIPTEMPITHLRGSMNKQVAGYLSWELGGMDGRRADKFGSYHGGGVEGGGL